MSQYTVRSGQNIYDVALTLHGSVEGIFDLLNSNSDISLDTTLKSGQILLYNDNFAVNSDVSSWLEDNGVRVKNGNHSIKDADVRKSIIEALSVQSEVVLPADELGVKDFYDKVAVPEIVIQQTGKSLSFSFQLPVGGFLAIDWGDNSGLEFYYHTDYIVFASHVFEDENEHLVELYGNGEFTTVDFTDIGGIYYALRKISVEEFVTPFPGLEKLNKLFIIKGTK